MQHADLKIFIYLLVCCSPPFEFLPNRTLLRRIWLCVRRMLFWHANSINEGVKQTTASGRTDTQAAARATRACTPHSIQHTHPHPRRCRAWAVVASSSVL